MVEHIKKFAHIFDNILHIYKFNFENLSVASYWNTIVVVDGIAPGQRNGGDHCGRIDIPFGFSVEGFGEIGGSE